MKVKLLQKMFLGLFGEDERFHMQYDSHIQYWCNIETTFGNKIAATLRGSFGASWVNDQDKNKANQIMLNSSRMI